MDPPSGVTVTVATSIEQGIQKNVVVVGQDPEEKGVGITVALDSVEGDIVHYEWQKTPCKRFSSDPGEPYTHCGTMKDYYWKDECVPVRTHEAYRKINDVKVWLEPSNETATWLGWGQNIPGSKATLRYIFPEKWMAGTWTKDGFTTTGTPDLSWNSQYYEEWAKQLKNYNFLAGDTETIPNLWSVTMVEVANPVSGNFQSLGVFGYFMMTSITNPMPEDLIGGSQWRVSCEEIKVYTKLHLATCDPPDMKIPSRTEHITINLQHIPMDLPGIWYIGIQVEMGKASIYYNYETIYEDWSYQGDTNWFSLKDINYDLNEHYFYSYVLLSTPCNPLEQNNCIDGSY
jgi:hypothetical protein